MKIKYIIVLTVLIVLIFLLFPRNNYNNIEVINVDHLPIDEKNYISICVPINKNIEMVKVEYDEDIYISLFNLYNINRNKIKVDFFFESVFLFELVDYKIDNEVITYEVNDLYLKSEVNELLDLLSLSLKTHGINKVIIKVNEKTYQK